MKETKTQPPPRIKEYACRIPRKYFICHGHGESSIDWHCGSYHDALMECGVENYNIMQYSSIIPLGAERVEKPKEYVHGSVLEAIECRCDTTAGIPCAAGIIFGLLVDKETKEAHGGIVCEIKQPDSDDKELLREKLYKALQALHMKKYDKKYDLSYTETIIDAFTPKEKFGTALSLIGFCSYVYPEL